MNDLSSQKDIENISYNLLKGSGSLDIFPTPVDNIVAYSELIIRNDIDVTKIHSSYRSKFPELLSSALNKIRGLFDRKEKVIYLDLSQMETRKKYVTLHEVGHGVLPWQQHCHDLLEDDDDSLSPETIDEFEQEANYFASVTLFQHDRFYRELSKYNLGIDSAMQLSKHFGASIHATLRRYVECSKKRCALMVLKDPVYENHMHCTLRNYFQSSKFSSDFGKLAFPAKLDNTWVFVQEYLSNRRFNKNGSFSMLTENGETTFNYHFFNNSYNAFVFFYPIGEEQKSRTKFIITNNGVEI
ncbi:ImmA/IrrE family metallo-endopeptidase [Dysgonomonas capnocytophagoides]|uniref:ImmA/IrrE family metallo-endopeptidase n=1 Tax=Dysgonomonas capnocytophagoides TaxID=45254 RepID=A0A4Y8L4K4_9BACT|nr:ImmA/IrrE family metallo-endopeptidase [Dysgonomonas capnocytophagoides]TFD96432.1 ImmA/IrrE family metallo-endopeptidase [Dysgonomonas capnocytophagoides]